MLLTTTKTADSAREPLTISSPDRQRLYPGTSTLGWRVMQRIKSDYYTPEEWYESLVDKLVDSETTWIDIGGGQFIFPHNQTLATVLAERCKLLVGVDPSDNILKNETVHVRVQSMLEDIKEDRLYDLATMRMVAEHVTDPHNFLSTLASMVKPGGHVVLVTPYKWSLVSVLAQLVPSNLHAACVRLLTPEREAQHVFPTYYKLNTYTDLKQHFAAAGFEEVWVEKLADCSVFKRFRIGTRIELALYRLCRRLRLGYPEANIVAVFRRKNTAAEI
ncbi:MAG: class I SAM-dependent methyltransferase [Aureliella sp.]